MKKDRTGRRAFLRSSITTAGVAWAAARSGSVSAQESAPPPKPARIRFAAIGLNHGHINGQVDSVIRGGGELVSFFAKEPDLAAAFAQRYPRAKRARSEREILDDPEVKLVVSASIPNERAPLGIVVMRHDIASHQFDQFLFFPRSDTAEVVASQVANVHHRDTPELEDFGDVMLRGNGGSGYIRVDWFTPDGLNTWGDGRLTILGTEGFIEIRKNVDIAGRPGGSHLFVVDQKETRYVDCSGVALPYGEHLVDDVLNRTETALPQTHCLLAMELALTAEKNARRLTLEK